MKIPILTELNHWKNMAFAPIPPDILNEIFLHGNFKDMMTYRCLNSETRKNVDLLFSKQILCIEQLILQTSKLLEVVFKSPIQAIIGPAATVFKPCSSTAQDVILGRLFIIFEKGFCKIESEKDIRLLKEGIEIVQKSFYKQSKLINSNSSLIETRCKNLVGQFSQKVFKKIIHLFANPPLEGFSQENYELKLQQIGFLFPDRPSDRIKSTFDQALKQDREIHLNYID